MCIPPPWGLREFPLVVSRQYAGTSGAHFSVFDVVGREPGVRVVVLQREATSRAKWVAVSRFVPHSIVSALRVNPETRSCLEDSQEETAGNNTLQLITRRF